MFFLTTSARFLAYSAVKLRPGFSLYSWKPVSENQFPLVPTHPFPDANSPAYHRAVVVFPVIYLSLLFSWHYVDLHQFHGLLGFASVVFSYLLVYLTATALSRTFSRQFTVFSSPFSVVSHQSLGSLLITVYCPLSAPLEMRGFEPLTYALQRRRSPG